MSQGSVQLAHHVPQVGFQMHDLMIVFQCNIAKPNCDLILALVNPVQYYVTKHTQVYFCESVRINRISLRIMRALISRLGVTDL